ncbi:DUF1419 domain-containing protein (plasmid) [Rhizobium ruizarguesonis]|uniref:DUF1419 domain-containing protein n=1 Tax=Rhizobium ruizarguesonis TaxID=2081791 RepID=A0ACD5EGK7_9HYPH|nr:DUF1419 domain-containing protein [Rhizobium leguminosarum]
MNTPAPTAKIFEGVATRPQMFRLFDRHNQRPDRWQTDAAPLYSGEWFEIDEALYDYMLDILPPLWMRGPIFALREFLTGSVTSIFLALRIGGTPRYLHGYSDLSDPTSVETMRAAIFERETQPVRVMSREERLEHICRRPVHVLANPSLTKVSPRLRPLRKSTRSLRLVFIPPWPAPHLDGPALRS